MLVHRTYIFSSRPCGEIYRTVIGSTAYGPGPLREDFARFRFLLGVTDSEGLFISGAP